MGAAVGAGLSDASVDAIGFVGGGVLAVCLIPQIGKLVLTRSAKDIAYAWSLLYCLGLLLSLVYLIFKNAIAAWIPIVVEIAGCITIICLKTFFEHTTAGRRWCAAADNTLHGDFSVRSIPGISHMASIHGDNSMHGRPVAGSVHGSKHGVLDIEGACLDVHCGVSGTPSEASVYGTTPQQQQHDSLYPSDWQGHQAVPSFQQAPKTADVR